MNQELINQIRSKHKNVNKRVSKKNMPDMNDPFAPDLKSLDMVLCWHCGQTYHENEIIWSSDMDMWMCKHYPKCDGGGLGFDIHKIKGV